MSAENQNFREIFMGNARLLDVRAPIEYSKGSFPSATNIPLLDDSDRHDIGITYKESGQEAAIALGESLVSGEKKEELVGRCLAFAQANPNGFLFCFRGGLRSRTVQRWMKEAGLEYPLIAGGYKAMRRFLIEELERNSRRLNFIVVAGRTGSGKTLALQKMPHMIDLEGLARHRGSSFGAMTVAQPGNIDFENALSIEMLKHKTAGNDPVFLEDEGKTIGSVCIPLALRNVMPGLPAVILDAPLSYRVDVSLDAYVVELLSMYQDRNGNDAGRQCFVDHHKKGLLKIRKRYGDKNYRETLALLDRAVKLHESDDLEGYRPYISKWLVDYYDPMYDYQISRKKRPILFRGGPDEIIDWANSNHAQTDNLN